MIGDNNAARMIKHGLLIYDPYLGHCVPEAKSGLFDDVWHRFWPEHDDLPVSVGSEKVVIPEPSKAIREVCAKIDDAIVAQFARNPKDLMRLDGRAFEELIAFILKGLDYEVELTKQTRDGGYDIRAIRHAEFRTCALIECKRYREDRPISVGVVRALKGVVPDHGTHGVIATTSYFSRDALRYIDEHKWLLEGRDLKGVVDWIEAYRRKRG